MKVERAEAVPRRGRTSVRAGLRPGVAGGCGAAAAGVDLPLPVRQRRAPAPPRRLGVDTGAGAVSRRFRQPHAAVPPAQRSPAVAGRGAPDDALRHACGATPGLCAHVVRGARSRARALREDGGALGRGADRGVPGILPHLPRIPSGRALDAGVDLCTRRAGERRAHPATGSRRRPPPRGRAGPVDQDGMHGRGRRTRGRARGDVRRSAAGPILTPLRRARGRCRDRVQRRPADARALLCGAWRARGLRGGHPGAQRSARSRPVGRPSAGRARAPPGGRRHLGHRCVADAAARGRSETRSSRLPGRRHGALPGPRPDAHAVHRVGDPGADLPAAERTGRGSAPLARRAGRGPVGPRGRGGDGRACRHPGTEPAVAGPGALRDRPWSGTCFASPTRASS